MSTHIVHHLFNEFLDTVGISPTTQNTLARWSTTFVPFETKQITFERHPLQTLCHLLERSGQPEHLRAALDAIPETLRNDLFFEVWSQATDSNKGGDKWGERNALAHYERLLNVIKTVVVKKLDALPEEKRHCVFGAIYRMAGHPQTQDLQWGEHHATEDLKRLICALHRKQSLDIPGKDIEVYSDLEKGLEVPSHFFHLHRDELPQGQIGLHNGMNNSLGHALQHALRISSECAQGYNLHCTYSATVDLSTDVTSAFLGQGGAITPPVLCLLEQWLDFFESNEDKRRLQIAHSRGAIEVFNALNLLPSSLRQRLIVIAVAPACFIPADLAYQVINLAIESDPVVKMAANRELLDAAHTLKLAPHSDTSDSHDMHGSSFREKMSAMIGNYIRTNDIC